MYNLKQMIKNELEKDKSLAAKLAQVAGLANPTPIYKFVNEPEREMDNFNGLLSIVKYLFLDKEREILGDYIKELDPNGKCARYSLEYAINNRHFDLASYMVDKLKNSSNAESREWALIYELNNGVLLNHRNYNSLLEDISEIRVKSHEIKTFIKMLQVHAYYENKMFEIMFQSCVGLEEHVKAIKDDYIRFCYLCRLGLILMAVNLHLNNANEARRYGEVVLNNSTQDSFRSLAYLQLGNSFVFENYDIASNHLEQARMYCKNLRDGGNRLVQVKRSINFLQNYWGKEPQHLDYESKDVSDVHGVAFYLIRQNRYEDALVALDSIDKSHLSNYQMGMHYFYRGLLDKDTNHFYNSVIHFKQSGDKFYRSLALIELSKTGLDEMVLKALSV
jgi:hypothetical protein